MSTARPLWVASVLLIAVGCQRSDRETGAVAATGPDWFEDVTAGRGLDFRHDPGPTGDYRLPQVMGSGAALFDADADGRLDLYLIHNAGPAGPPNRLFLQQPDGSFRTAPASSGLAVAGHGMGAAVGDVDNDGRPDLVLTEHGRTRLFVNRGGGVFADVSQASGIDNPAWGTSAAFFDFDRDGWLDLVVANYVAFDPAVKCPSVNGSLDFCQPLAYKGTVDRLFRNLGRQPDGSVRFEDVTVRSGLASGTGNGLGVICADLTGDGWPDIFIANDGQRNRLWVNQKNGTFVDEAAIRGVALTGTASTAGNMGIACGDVDGDGLLDLFVTHLGEEMHSLWRQEEPGYFRDQTASLGLAGGSWRGTGFGTALADFDRDGWPDLVLANGRVGRRPDSPRESPPAEFWKPYQDRNQLFVGVGRGRFRDASSETTSLSGTPAVARGLAVGDVDDDGGPDLLVTEIAGPARLLRNTAPAQGHWLGIRALDPKHNRDALGSTITLRAGERRFTALVTTAGSYLCASDPRVHFGLGSATQVDEVVVRWWDGSAERFVIPAIDRYVEVRKGSGSPIARSEP